MAQVKQSLIQMKIPKTFRELHQMRKLLFLRFQIKFTREMLRLNQGKKKNRVPILTEKFSEEELFPYLLSTGKFGYNAL